MYASWLLLASMHSALFVAVVAADSPPHGHVTCTEFSEASDAERIRDLERAARLHANAAKLCPNDGRARYSEARADFLVTHAEGSYAPLILLERAQAGEYKPPKVKGLIFISWIY